LVSRVGHIVSVPILMSRKKSVPIGNDLAQPILFWAIVPWILFHFQQFFLTISYKSEAREIKAKTFLDSLSQTKTKA
jgi:hypothetical protein